MKRLFIFLALVAAILIAGFSYRYLASQSDQKIYVAVEADGTIIVLDSATHKIVSNIDLSVEHQGGKLSFHPHNVQVAPDNKTVWVTANAGGHQEHSQGFLRLPEVLAHGDEEEFRAERDEIIVINPVKDKILARIPLGVGIHLAHVVLTPDSSFAYATAQTENAIYKIDAKTLKIVRRIETAKGSEPHGLRVTPDGLTAYIAMLGGKSLGRLELQSDTFSEVPLNGQVVQTGVTLDGKFVLASLYDTKQLAVYQTDEKELKLIWLPESAKGPIQMYPTPDSRFVYLADQGYYFSQPTGERVYKIDLTTMAVVKEIKAGQGPHGVVVSPDGKFVYVTNLVSGDVSIIDTVTDQEIKRIKVGQDPNGISVWTR